MKRQAIRSAVLVISFLFMPVTFYYMSPALIVMGAAQGLMVGSFIVFAGQFVAALLLGRAFCGWVCPAAGLQEACLAAQSKPARGGRANWIKYLIWMPWMLTIVAVATRNGGLHSVNFAYQTAGGVSLSGVQSYVAFYAVLGLIVILALAAGRRGFCHYACWMAPFMIIGTTLRNAMRLPGLRLRADPEKCTGCGRCTRECVMSLPVQEMVARSRMDDPECVLCGKCVDGCPRQALSYTIKA